MSTYTLDGDCQHKRSEPWNWTVDDCFTCLLCFQRIRVEVHPEMFDIKVTPLPAPSGTCAHPRSSMRGVNLLRFPEKLTAICQECGCLLWHEDGPGSWHPVIFYGYRIREEYAP